jgi:hypothetical protein
VDFEAYLISKKIDSSAFQLAENDLWNTWNSEFLQTHPNSFTAQKLYLINPVRRKYPLKQQPVQKDSFEQSVAKSRNEQVDNSNIQEPGASPLSPKLSIPRPVFKPKPKMN